MLTLLAWSVVKRSSQAFNKVDPDQAMDWINGTGKKGGGSVAVTKTTSALCRWTLPYNLRSHITYRLCLESAPMTTKQLKLIMTKRGGDDESAVLSTLQRLNIFFVLAHPVHNRCKTLQQQTSQQVQSRTLYFVPGRKK